MKKMKKCCNMCGKEIKEQGLDREDSLWIEKKWGYFSNKDGIIHKICLCEACYDSWIRTFSIPPVTEENTELLY